MSTGTERPRLTQAERRAQSRSRLLGAAAQAIAEFGYRGTSVDAIAELAGYTKGAFYANFSQKGDLLMALVEQQCNQQLAAIDALFAQPGSLLDRLREVAEFFIGDEELRRRSLLYLELSLQAIRDPELGRRYTDFQNDLRSRVATLLEREAARLGQPLPAPSDQLASAVLGLGDGLILQQLIDPEQAGVDAYMTILHLILDGTSASGRKVT